MITFVNPTGDDVTFSQQPLHGRAPWPGIVLDDDGAVVDWPGWRLEGGVWVAGDEYDWAVGAVVVEFEAGEVVDAVVDYPAATPTCEPTPYGAVGSSGGSANGSSAPVVEPPQTSTLEAPTARPDMDARGLFLVLFAVTLASAGFDFAQPMGPRGSPGCQFSIETPEEFTSRAARTRRTRPARRSSARARSRGPRA